jgi:DNA-binding IclR family transcriptional regulator
VLRDGYALTSGGLVPGVASVAAPVFTAGESLPLVVALALPAQQATPEVLREIAADLLDTTAAMSAEIGYQPSRPAQPGARRTRA